MATLPITLCMITRDEEDRLAACLERVAGHVERIVVVDAESEDGTRDVARSLGAEVVERPWEGFVAARRHALSLARGEWVLMIDADELVGDRLWEELRARGFPDVEADGYQVRRRMVYLGRTMGHVWQPDWKTVLFRRERARVEERSVHESILVDGRVERLGAELLHHSYRSLEDHDRRIRRYAELAAADLHEAGQRAGWLDLWFRPAWRFFTEYVLRGGFLDGRAGWIATRRSAWSIHLRYRLLAERWKEGRE